MKRFLALVGLTILSLAHVGFAVDYPSRLADTALTKFPYNMVGQVFFQSGQQDYIGSGTVIRARSILTAGHNLYDPDTGWSTDLLFRRGAYGETVKVEAYGTRIYLLSGYRQNANYYGQNSVRTFAQDTGGLIFGKQLAGGGYTGWTTRTYLLSNPYVPKIAIGYGAEGNHTGDYPLYVSPDRAFSSTLGAFWESRGAYFEGGMSGGPVFATDSDGQKYLTGVVVSGTDYPYVSGGVRVLNAATATFIQTYLR